MCIPGIVPGAWDEMSGLDTSDYFTIDLQQHTQYLCETRLYSIMSISLVKQWYRACGTKTHHECSQ
jgi:hypothetical protein